MKPMLIAVESAPPCKAKRAASKRNARPTLIVSTIFVRVANVVRRYSLFPARVSLEGSAGPCNVACTDGAIPYLLGVCRCMFGNLTIRSDYDVTLLKDMKMEQVRRRLH
jgi:hypothetical protein